MLTCLSPHQEGKCRGITCTCRIDVKVMLFNKKQNEKENNWKALQIKDVVIWLRNKIK